MNKKYITGTGQSVFTTRRVQIYQKESGIEPTSRPPPLKKILNLFLENNSLENNHGTEEVMNILSDSGNDYDVQSYSFDHPIDNKVRVNAMEVSAGNSIVTSLYMSKVDGTNDTIELSRSLAVAAVVPQSEGIQPVTQLQRGLTDMSDLLDLLTTMDELVADPVDGYELTTQSIEESFGTVREVSLYRHFAESSDEAWVKGLQLPEIIKTTSFSESESIKLGSISRSVSFASNPESQTNEKAMLYLSNGFMSPIDMKSFSFFGSALGDGASPRGTSPRGASPRGATWRIPNLGRINFGKLPTIDEVPNKREREDNEDEESRKLSRTDWDEVL